MTYESELFYNRKKYSNKFHKIKAKYIGEYQIDLLIYTAPEKYTQAEKLSNQKRSNNSGEYIFVMIDVWSRYGLAWLIKQKTAQESLNAYEECIKEFYKGVEPYKITMDAGKEFLKEMKQYFTERDIEVITAKGDGLQNKNFKGYTTIVERFNQTIRNKLKILTLTEGKRKTINQDILNILVNKYNRTLHKGIMEIPFDCFFNGHMPHNIIHKYHIDGKNNKGRLIFKPNDKVRIMKQFNLMSKDAKKKEIYSKKVYRVLERNGHRYLVSDGNEYPYSRLLLTKAPVTPERQIPEPVRAMNQRPRREQPLNITERQPRVKQVIKVNDRVKVKGVHFGRKDIDFFYGVVHRITPKKIHILFDDGDDNALDLNKVLIA